MSFRETSKLLSDLPFLSVATLGLAGLIGLAWFLFRDPSGSTAKYTHLHCPSCRDEVPYQSRNVGKKCTNCTAGAVLVPTVGSIADGGEATGGGSLLLFLVVGAVIVQASIFFGISRYRILVRREQEYRDRPLLARCPFCQRKVSFPASKASTWITCSQCKTAFELPEAG